MSRKPNEDDGSLELLLDTICNTFGGVLFISILVVLLLNMSSNEAATTPPDGMAVAALIEAEVRLARTNRELEELLTAVDAQKKIADLIVDPELRDLIRDSGRLQQGIVERTKQKVEGVDQIAKDQIDINEKSQEIMQHEQSLQDAKASLAGIERRLKKEIESRTKAAKLPKGRATQKMEISMFLKAGRLCTYLKREGNLLVENGAEIATKRDQDNAQYIEPKPGAGIVIDVDGNNAEIDVRLNNFDPSEHYLNVFVWPDSFRHFAVFKDQLVVQEFEYHLIPFQGDQKIYFGAIDEPVEVQ